MAKEFNPDEFLAATQPIADAQAEIERKNAERTAMGQPPMTPQQAQGQQAAAMAPSGAPIAPVRPGFTEAPGEWTVNNVVAPVYGAGKAIADVGGAALSNPVVQTGLELAGGGLAAKKFLVNPVLEALKPVGEAAGSRINEVTSALNRQAAAAEATEAGRAARAAAKMPQAVRPIAPSVSYNVPTMSVPQVPTTPGPIAPAPAAAPTMAPAAAPAQAAEASLLDKTSAMIRQLAANKVFQGAMKGGAGVAAALTPGNIGQNYNFPQSGPLRGSEINPRTGRPWTPQELMAYKQQYGG